MIATIAFGLLIIAQILQSVSLFRTTAKDRISPWLALGSSILLLITVIQRSIAIKFFALTNMYESLLFLAMLASLMAFAITRWKPTSESKALPYSLNILAIIFLALASSPIAPPLPLSGKFSSPSAWSPRFSN